MRRWCCHVRCREVGSGHLGSRNVRRSEVRRCRHRGRATSARVPRLRQSLARQCKYHHRRRRQQKRRRCHALHITRHGQTPHYTNAIHQSKNAHARTIVPLIAQRPASDRAIATADEPRHDDASRRPTGARAIVHLKKAPTAPANSLCRKCAPFVSGSNPSDNAIVSTDMMRWIDRWRRPMVRGLSTTSTK